MPIDTADCREVERALETFPLAGVMTCPSIIVRAGKPFGLALMAKFRADRDSAFGPGHNVAGL